MTDAQELIEDVDRDVYLRIKSDLVVIGDSVMTDRYHTVGQNNEQYDPTNPQNEIGGIIPAFSLSGWLRHGIESVVNEEGGEICHPGEANANFMREEIYERDLDNGYHPKGSCLPDEDADTEEGCVVLDMFGGFSRQPGKFMRRPIQFNPNRSKIDYERGQAEGHYRKINRNVVSRNEEDARTPLRDTQYDAVANLDGCWHLTFRELEPEFIGVIDAAAQYLDEHNTDFMHQLGGSRNFGGGIVDTYMVNPLYSKDDLKTLFNRARGKTDSDRKTEDMQQKDEKWQEEYRPAFRESLRERIED